MGTFRHLDGLSASLVFAVVKMMSYHPCRQSLPCFNKARQSEYRFMRVARICWRCLPSDQKVRKRAFDRLLVSLFACETSFAKSMGWERFIYYFDESEMLGVNIREQYDSWYEIKGHRLNTPIRALAHLLKLHNSITLDAVDHFVSLIGPHHQEAFNSILYRLLLMGCQRAIVQDDLDENRARIVKRLYVQYHVADSLVVIS